FSRDAQSDLGRGGRYAIGDNEEAATGVTLYVNALMDMVACAGGRRAILVSHEENVETCRALQEKGYATVFALEGAVDEASAKAQGCGFYYAGKAICPVNL